MNEKIAKILGVTEENISALPTDILGSMQNVIENIEVKSEDDAKMLYAELEGYWSKGIVLLGLSDVARDTGIALDTLKNLDYDVQKELVYEYMADSSNTSRLYDIVNKALSVMELNTIANLIGVPVSKLREYPHEVQTQLCGIYAMENDVLSQYELINRLKGAMNV